jgi:hypothetical protein
MSRKTAARAAPGDRRLIGAGQYRLYENPDGSAVIEWRNEPSRGGFDIGDGDAYGESHTFADGEQTIPAPVWHLLKGVAEGRQLGPQAALRLLTGGKVPRRGLE